MLTWLPIYCVSNILTTTTPSKKRTVHLLFDDFLIPVPFLFFFSFFLRAMTMTLLLD